MKSWRLLPLRVDEPFYSMAIDEAILRLKAGGKSPNTLRFWRWQPSTVSLGYFQSVDREVDLEVAKKRGVAVVRRITGGGAVFHDQDGELTYSVVCGQNDVPRDIEKSFEAICEGLIRGFKRLGLDACFSPLNDISVGGKKISGSAQTRKWRCVLQHGTILIDPDIRLMFELLRVSPEKITDKFISSAYERVTSIKRELGEKPSFEEVKKAMRLGFEESFCVSFEEGELSSEEISLAKELIEKYASYEWLMKR